jgi:hypothetical protein
MQSENGILLLFYIFLSHRNEKRGVGCKKGGCCVLYLCLGVLNKNGTEYEPDSLGSMYNNLDRH